MIPEKHMFGARDNEVLMEINITPVLKGLGDSHGNLARRGCGSQSRSKNL